jgi:molybdopterin biosynthesis enzyme
MRVRLEHDDDGRRVAHLLEGQQSHRLASLPATDAFALLSAGSGLLEEGSSVPIVALPGRERCV